MHLWPNNAILSCFKGKIKKRRIKAEKAACISLIDCLGACVRGGIRKPQENEGSGNHRETKEQETSGKMKKATHTQLLLHNELLAKVGIFDVLTVYMLLGSPNHGSREKGKY